MPIVHASRKAWIQELANAPRTSTHLDNQMVDCPILPRKNRDHLPDQGLATLDGQPVLAALTRKGKRPLGQRLPKTPQAGITLSRCGPRTAGQAGTEPFQ
jgi:hypothetical protein